MGTQVRPATVMMKSLPPAALVATGAPPADTGGVGTTASADPSAAGRVIQNPYCVGTACCPEGVGGWNELTGETAAEVTVTGAPM